MYNLTDFQPAGSHPAMCDNMLNVRCSTHTHTRLGGLDARIWRFGQVKIVLLMLMMNLAFLQRGIGCTIVSCTIDFDLCLSAVYESDGFFAVDVVVEGISGRDVHLINIVVDYSNGSNFTMNEALTEASLLSSLQTDFEITFGTNSVELVDDDGGSFCTGTEVTQSAEQVLFTIYFSGAAGECTEFVIDDESGMLFALSGSTFSVCTANIETECESEQACIPDVEISGNIESIPQECYGSVDHGVPDVGVKIRDLAMVEDFNCLTETDNYGDYACPVTEGRDYRIVPSKDDFPGCGITATDLDILQDHLLGTTCLTENWEMLAADANISGTVSALDLTTINKVYLEIDLSMQSWRFVPTAQFVLFDPPACTSTVPSHTPYIQINDIGDDEDMQDFVGIKVGDLNGTCTDCNGERRPEQNVSLGYQKDSKGYWEYYFESEIGDLGVYYLEFTLPSRVKDLDVISLLPGAIMDYAIHGRTLKVSYINMISGGEKIAAQRPIIAISGKEIEDIAPQISSFSTSEYISKALGAVAIVQGNKDRPIFNSGFDKTGVAEIYVFPNPAQNGVFVIDASQLNIESAELEIYNDKGSLVYSSSLKTGVVRAEVNLSTAPAGLYCWVIHGDQASPRRSGKIVIH